MAGPYDPTSWALDHVRTIGPFDQKITRLRVADGWMIVTFEDGSVKNFPPGSLSDAPRSPDRKDERR